MDQTPEERFVETLGLIFQSEGMPPIAGRILGQLVLAEEALSLTEIAGALRVSKASVSTNVRLLEMHSIAVREPRPGSRQDHWRAETRLHAGMLLSLAEKFNRNADRIDAIVRTFDDTRSRPRAKVAEFSEFYRSSADFLSSWVETLDTGTTPIHGGAPAPDKTAST